MFEYFKKKLEELLDSVLEPFWKWTMAASPKAKMAILLVCSAAGGAVAYPDVPRELYMRADALTRAAIVGPQKIPLSGDLTEKTRSTAKRLSQTVKGDLLKLTGGSITPWSAVQAVAAAAGMETVILDKNAITSFVRSNTVPGCACWTEIPKKTFDAQCIFISGWIMAALADMDVPATSAEVRYALDAQTQMDGGLSFMSPISHSTRQHTVLHGY